MESREIVEIKEEKVKEVLIKVIREGAYIEYKLKLIIISEDSELEYVKADGENFKKVDERIYEIDVM